MTVQEVTKTRLVFIIHTFIISDVHTFDDDMDLGCNVETHDLEHGNVNTVPAA
jgi:hypothetical protein